MSREAPGTRSEARSRIKAPLVTTSDESTSCISPAWISDVQSHMLGLRREARILLWRCVIQALRCLCLYRHGIFMRRLLEGCEVAPLIFILSLFLCCFTGSFSSLFHYCGIKCAFVCLFLLHDSRPIPLPLTAQLLMCCSLPLSLPSLLSFS